MTKDILINISGLQMDVDPNDPIEMMTREKKTSLTTIHHLEVF